MDCAVDERLNKLKISPSGCKPVSNTLCESGFMAPAESVLGVDDPLSQCCKCKEGEVCGYCKDPNACTVRERMDYVTTDDCFTIPPPPPPTTTPGPSPPEEPKKKTFLEKYFWILLAAFFVLLLLAGGYTYYRRRRK